MGGQRTKFAVKKDNNVFGSGWRKKNVVIRKNEQQ